jgi:hypothetical protein
MGRPGQARCNTPPLPLTRRTGEKRAEGREMVMEAGERGARPRRSASPVYFFFKPHKKIKTLFYAMAFPRMNNISLGVLPSSLRLACGERKRAALAQPGPRRGGAGAPCRPHLIDGDGEAEHQRPAREGLDLRGVRPDGGVAACAGAGPRRGRAPGAAGVGASAGPEIVTPAAPKCGLGAGAFAVQGGAGFAWASSYMPPGGSFPMPLRSPSGQEPHPSRCSKLPL